MLKIVKQKIYCYADESGQDTKGELFLVSVIVGDKERDELRAVVEKIERETGKRHIKWQRSSHRVRVAYLERLIQENILKGKVCFSVYRQFADAFCGFIRDHIEGQEYTKELYSRAKRKGILVSVE